jgi:hypothetical protein
VSKDNGYIYVVTTLDTKSTEAFYVKSLIKKTGADALIVDLTTVADHSARVRILQQQPWPAFILREKVLSFVVTGEKLSPQCLSPLNYS